MAVRKILPASRFCAFALLLLLAMPLKDARPGAVRGWFNFARSLFQHGKLVESQREAQIGCGQLKVSDPAWAAEFHLLEAETLDWQGSYDQALRVLDAYPDGVSGEGTIKKLAMEGAILSHQHHFALASGKLGQAEALCNRRPEATCGEAMQARGILAIQEQKPGEALPFLRDTLAFARTRRQDFLEATASLSLGWAELHTGHFDEAVDWSRSAYRLAEKLGAEDLAQVALGNLGWGYYELGDGERAVELFQQARKTAATLGDISTELSWISASGYIYRDRGDLPRAAQSYREALSLAIQIDSKEDIANALEDLAQVSVDAGKLDEASAYIDQVAPMETAGGGRLSANVLLTQGMLAAARRQDRQAESLFRAVQSDRNNPTTTRLGAGEQLALLFESEGNRQAAEQMYKTTLSAFDSAQAELKSDESKLPFVTNAARIYDDYIHLLVRQGRTDEALAAADRSRARTLAQGMGAAPGSGAQRSAALDPRQVAAKSGSTLLFYWLGEKESCLWAIAPNRLAFFALPAKGEIAVRVERYRKAVLDAQDPLDAGNEDGQALYRALVAPAAQLIDRQRPVTILADGELSQLNFETLIVAGSGMQERGSNESRAAHYWIDDATLVSAPSLAMLAAAKPDRNAKRSLLLLGNPVSPSEEYPSLPLFGFEMKNVQKHFDPTRAAVFGGGQAVPAAYLAGNPDRYSYIHFVSHAVSSRTDPLDSAIILSGSTGGADSFKLYARDIMRHPIGARLVTISACYGSGTRSYAGEGLVGLSWAFLRAGAQSVIGALWEVSDDSTPRLMDALYQGIEDGESPAEALRKAKLGLLHSNGRFEAPFYWAPFQIYSSR